MKAILEGIKNYNFPKPEIEELAKQRAQVCMGCEFYQDEPIPMLQTSDERIPEFAGKSCRDCGCVLSFKSRQNIDVCVRWQNL